MRRDTHVARIEKEPTAGTEAAARRLSLVLGTSAESTDLDPSRELLEKAQSGDRDAFRGLLESHQERVFRFVSRMLRCDRDTAADLAQEVFLRVWKGLPSFDGRARFTTWLYKISLNLCITEQRRRRAQKRGKATFSLDQPVSGTDNLFVDPVAMDRRPEVAADQHDFALAVRVAIAELPDEFRDAVALRDLEDLDYEEIAEVLDVPPGTVRSRIHRGRLLLQAKLERFRP